MEKIYVGKTIFEMPTDAKKLLENYLNDLKIYVMENNIDIDVFEDIKYRIEEKLHKVLGAKNQIISEDISDIISQMGKPNEIFSSESQKKQFTFIMPKLNKLYRDSENGKIMGVCYGIAKAIDVRPLYVRLFFILLLILTQWFALLGYIVLAILMPEKKKVNIGKNNTDEPDWLTRLFNGIKRVIQSIINALE